VRVLWSLVGVVALSGLLVSLPSPTRDASPSPDALDPHGRGTAFPSGGRPLFSDGSLSSLGVHPLDHRARVGGEGLPDTPQIQTQGVPREFYFSRVAYTGFGGFSGRGGNSWRTDFPRADQIFLSFIDRLLPTLDAYEREFVVQVHDPDVRRFPFLYAVEVGRMSLTQPEVKGLRDYLLSGGFLVVDDFWGTREWEQLDYQIGQVLPEFEIVDLDMDHPIFSTFYEIDEIIQVPNVQQGVYGGQTHERDGYVPMVRGIHDDNGRLMVVINWNTDLGDAWEWADEPRYPLKYSTYAYEMGVNLIVYAMSH
jgi:hypothetical protein